MNIPVLCYHSMAIEGNDYADNDLVAFGEDLRALDEAGFEIQPLHELVATWLATPVALEGRPLVALTCDDGSDFDARDLPHPVAGVQRSMLGRLRDFRAHHPGRQPGLHLTSFPIVSPAARERLDTVGMIGKRWWNDDWWAEALASGLMGIANHSWEHNHDQLPDSAFPGLKRGTFRTVDREDIANFEIATASEYLHRHAPGPSTRLFAYPYGDKSDFLQQEYFPRHARRLGIDAAFDTEPGPWTRTASRWALPRYVFRRDWRSPEGLRAILRDAGAGGA